MADGLAAFRFQDGYGLSMRPNGTVLKTYCPICGSTHIGNAWKIPMEKIDPPVTVFGGYFNQIPTLKTPFEIFGFDLCRDCESVFLNPLAPRDEQIDSYRRSVHYINKMKDEAEWVGYHDRYRDMQPFIPQGATSLVDAACGLGQVLFIARDDQARRWRRLVGLELSEPYVKNLNENRIEAHVFDIDRDDHRALIAPDSVDFVSFFEAFEHVERPLAALAKLLDLLRPGGRIHFSAQRYGDDVNLAIRPGEPIYIGPKVVDMLPLVLPCTLVAEMMTGSRYFIVLERTDAPVTVAHLAIASEGAPGGIVPALPQRVAKPRPASARAAPARPEEAPAKAAPLPEAPLPAPFLEDGGSGFVVRLDVLLNADELRRRADADGAPNRSTLVLLEDGNPLGPAHALHAAIRATGAGRYSHWGSELYFSTSDNSDPNANGRRYSFRFD